MATGGLGRAVTSTLELLAGYAYTSPTDPARTDPAYSQLQPLGLAAQALIQERNDLRDQLQAALDQLNNERQAHHTCSTHLQELIRRVRTLPPNTSSELLGGIHQPEEDSEELTFHHLLDTPRTPLKAAGAGNLHVAVELPTVNAYLDRALAKARQCVDLYSLLELSADPSIRKTWAELVTGLDANLSKEQPLIQTVKAKAEALMVLGSMEKVSLEAAVRGFQRMRNKLEDVVAESESWVVEELYHERLPPNSGVQDKIQNRIRLAQEPLTVESLEELMRIFEDYEYLRKTAVLQPWAEQIQPDVEWWRLVSAAQQVSEAVLRSVTLGDSEVEELRREMNRLQRDSTSNKEGVYTFLSGVFDLLLRAEELKQGCLNIYSASMPLEVLHDLCRDVLNVAMVFAAFADEPLTELLRLNSALNRPDCKPQRVAQELHTTLHRLLKDCTISLTEKVSLKWLQPTLEHCRSHGSQELNARISTVLTHFEKEEYSSFEVYQARRREISTCCQLTLEEMQSRYEVLQKELNDIRINLENTYSLVSVSSPAEAGLSTAAKLRQVNATLQTWKVSGATQPAKPSDNQTQVSQMETVFPAVVSLAEAMEREELTAQCRQALASPLPPQERLSMQFQNLATVLTEAKTALKSRSAVSDSPSLLRKSRHILDSVVRNTEDLAKGTLDPGNEKKTREALQKLTASLGEAGQSGVLDGVIEALKLERQQVHIRVQEDYAVADTLVSAPSDSSPSKPSAFPTADQKLTDGFTYIRETTYSLIKKVLGHVNDQEYQQKTAALKQMTGLERLLQEQGIVLWLLQEVAQSAQELLMPVLSATLDTLEEVTKHVQDPGDKQDILAAIYSVREEGAQSTRPLTELILEVEELAQARIRLLRMDPKQPGSKGVLMEIERLESVYNAELVKHGITISITQEETEVLQGSDDQATALVRLTIMERAFRALAEKASVQKQEVKDSEDYIARYSHNIYSSVMDMLQVVSVTEAVQTKRSESQLDDELTKIERATGRLTLILKRLYTELESRNGPVTQPDLSTQIQELTSPAGYEEASASVEQPRHKLQGFPSKASPYASVDKAVTEAGNRLLRLLDLRELQDLQAVGRERLAVSSSSGDALSIVNDKLEFMKDALEYMVANYKGGTELNLMPIFDVAKRNLNSARGMLKNSQRQQEIWSIVASISKRVNENRGAVKECLETVETTMQRVLSELATDYEGQFQAVDEGGCDEPAETRKKLSALPSASDKVSTGMDFLMRQTGHILASLSLEPSAETITQLQHVASQTGQDKVLLQQTVLHSELKTISEALKTMLQSLYNQLLHNVRHVGLYQGNGTDLEPALQDIETAVTENGLSLGLVGDLAAILDAQIEDIKTEEGDLQEFTAANVEVNSDTRHTPHRTRLMALPTSAERLSKGMDFLQRQVDSVAQSLTISLERGREEQEKRIREASGQDQLLLQQDLIHSGLKLSSSRLNSHLRDTLRKLEGMVRTLANLKGYSWKIQPELTALDSQLQSEGVRTQHITQLLDSLDRLILQPSMGQEYEETEAEVESSPSDELRTRLAAGSTSGARLCKGLEYVIRQETDLMELLGLFPDPEYQALSETCEEAEGQEKLLHQQTLLYRGLKAATGRLQTRLHTGLEQALALSDHLTSFLAPGPSKATFQQTIDRVKRERGAVGERIDQLDIILEHLASLRSDLHPHISGVRPPKAGGTSSTEPELQELSRYLGAPNAQLTSCIGELKSQVAKVLQGLIAHSRYLDGFVHAGQPKQLSIFAFNRLETELASPTLAGLPALLTALQHLETQQDLLSFTNSTDYDATSAAVEVAETEEGPGTKLSAQAPKRRKKLSSVPTSSDRLDTGMVYILKELGTLVDTLQAPPETQAEDLMQRIDRAEGQEKLVLRQGLVHAEVKRLAGTLQIRVTEVFSRLMGVLNNLEFDGQQAEELSRLQSLPSPHFYDLEEAEALLETAVSQLAGYKETEVFHEEIEIIPEPRRAKLSAVPSSGDKVGKGMDLLLRLTGQIYHTQFDSPADYMEADLLSIRNATGQDKLLLQQVLLHKELKDILQVLEGSKTYQSTEEVKQDSVVVVTKKLHTRIEHVTASSDSLDDLVKLSLAILTSFKVRVKPETQTDLENMKTADSAVKSVLQRQIIRSNLIALQEQAEVLRTDSQEISTVNSTLTRLKVALETLTGGNLTKVWTESPTLLLKLRILASHLDNFESRFKQSFVEELTPYLNISEDTNILTITEKLKKELHALCEAAEVKEETGRLIAARRSMENLRRCSKDIMRDIATKET